MFPLLLAPLVGWFPLAFPEVGGAVFVAPLPWKVFMSPVP